MSEVTQKFLTQKNFLQHLVIETKANIFLNSSLLASQHSTHIIYKILVDIFYFLLSN